VSCAVAMFSATSTTERIRFNMLNRGTGHRLKQQYIDSVTEDVVSNEDRVRGYAVEKDEYVIVEDDELSAIQLESNHTITIDKFVDRTEVDPLYLDSAYFLAPSDRVGLEAYAVIRDAMAASGTVGLARVVLHRRERLVMLEPRGKGLVAMGLRYANEVRSEDSAFEDIADVDVDAETLKLASHIIDTKRGTFDPSEFEDRYETALVELVRSKQAGRAPNLPRDTPRPSNVVNLMDALKRSLAAEGKGTSKSAKTKPANDDPPPKAKAVSKAGKPAASKAAKPKRKVG
jgi:DNA end-binding protein Ku